MAVDPALAELGKPIYHEQQWPHPICPDCGSGHVRFTNPAEAEDPRSERDHEGFDYDWIRGTFSIVGNCTNPACGQPVQAVGSYRVIWVGRRARNDGYTTSYEVKHVYPPLRLFPVPEAAPSNVREGVERAGHVLFADPPAAATALRATLERFLTSQGIAAKAGNRHRGADERIKEWRKAAPGRDQVADLLFPTRWFGNKGTHEDANVTVEEVLDAALCLDEAFHRIYLSPDIDARAEAIRKASGKPQQP